jgi:acetylornithine deacetylase/succinyl-diaminopimelate desuccinylase-like protein
LAVIQLSQWVERQSNRFLGELRALLNFPTVSAEGRALEETSDFVLDKLRSLGFQAEKLRVQGAPPLILAERKGRSNLTLVFYNHYDVQPVDPLNEWESGPFSGEVRDGKMFARGVADDKGDLYARINAVEALLETLGELPLTVKFVVEGEEEVGSPHLHDYIERYGERMKGDVCFWEGSDLTLDGRPQFYLGVKGLLYVELRIETAERDQHSMYAPLVPNPAWRMVWLLNRLKDPRGRILIPGFYDDVIPPTRAELAAVRRNEFKRELVREALAVRELLPTRDDFEAARNLLFNPTCNIAGFASGYGGPGAKTVLPREARLKMDFRLVPRQDPHKILQLLKRYLAELGYEDVQLQVFGAEKPAKTSMETPYLKPLVEEAGETYGARPLVWPTMYGTGPMALFINELGLPSVMPPGVAYTGSAYHAPNEHIHLSHYLKGVEFVARSLMRLGGHG